MDHGPEQPHTDTPPQVEPTVEQAALPTTGAISTTSSVSQPNSGTTGAGTAATAAKPSSRPKRPPKQRWQPWSRELESRVVSSIVGPGLKFTRWSFEPRVTRQVHPEVQALWDAGEPVIYAMWHGRMFITLNGFDPAKTCFLVSASNDGKMITDAIEQLGFSGAIQGSSHRGGVRASKAMATTLLKEKKSVIMTIDGPRGTRYRAKKGVIKLSSITQVPIVPVTGSGKILLRQFLDSWDNFHAPMFFTSTTIQYGEPIQIPSDIDEETMHDYRKKLTVILRGMTKDLDEAYGHTFFY